MYIFSLYNSLSLSLSLYIYIYTYSLCIYVHRAVSKNMQVSYKIITRLEKAKLSQFKNVQTYWMSSSEISRRSFNPLTTNVPII